MLTINTIKFQEMVSKSAKGASENKLLPITSMMLIAADNGMLSLVTTDTSNTLMVRTELATKEDFYVVVPVDVFSKLVSKTNSETITLTLKENSLEVKGNGVYNIPLPMDEDGPVRFPDHEFAASGEPEIVNLTTIKTILAINKAAVSKTIDTPCLCAYYLGDMVITTDENAICFNDIRVMKEDALISSDMMELLALNTTEKIQMHRTGNEFLFITPDMVLHGEEHDGKTEFPAAESIGYLSETFGSMCKLPKLLLQSVIDRLSLFIEPYDKNGAYFTFTKEGVRITSKRSSCDETIHYQESKDFSPFICCIDIPMLKAQIDANPSDFIELWYGHPQAVKLTSGKVTQVIALLEDEELEKNASGK